MPSKMCLSESYEVRFLFFLIKKEEENGMYELCEHFF